jgi:predicted Rossmann fold flavoprotein
VNCDVLVVGGGPAGMMAAGAAAENGLSVCLLEKNAVLGKKLRITGKGRCNVTNNSSVRTVVESTPTNGRFLYGAVTRFGPEDTIRFFEDLGVPLKTERGNRVFPVSDRAADIAEAMIGYIRSAGVQILHGEAERLLQEDGHVTGAVLKDGTTISASNVVVCCGGVSYPVTGSTGDGYRFAGQAGHTVTPLRPSLVPLAARGEDIRACRDMMGLSLKNIAVRVTDTETSGIVYEDFGEMLFTHFGLSGPVILSASANMPHMSPGRYRIAIDLKPALSPEKLDARLVREFSENRNRDFSNSLGALLPRRMIPVAVRRSGFPPETKCNAITREMRRDFGTLLKDFEIDIEGFRPIAEAIVTSGGVSVDEVDPKTMESKLVRGLYFAGEVLDVDAYTGGFNLQIAFSTGRLAGKSISAKNKEQKTKGQVVL